MSGQRMIWRWWCIHQHQSGVPSSGDGVTIDARSAYNRWWQCNHRRLPGIPFGGDDVPIIAGVAYQPVVMMNISTLGHPTIWRRWREHQCQMGVPSGYDDENINASPSYHPIVMMRISTPVRSTIRWWCRCQHTRSVFPLVVMRDSVIAAVVFVPAIMFCPLLSALPLCIIIVHNTL
jgi:hypothetical protein